VLDNFQLAAIVKEGGETRLLQVPLHQGLQDDLARSWGEQFEAFVENVDEIAFDPGYQPEAHERFCLDYYELPAFLVNETSQTVATLEAISTDDELLDKTKGIVGFAQDGNGRDLVLFQNFNRAHVIRPGRFLFLQSDTYETADRPGLTLDGKLGAVYFPADRKLLFHSFRMVNTFLPLADFNEEASEQDIRNVLNHGLLAPEDADALAIGANQWFRKRFAMLGNSGILDQYTATEIAADSDGYEVDVQVDGGQIVFPSDKHEAKRLLQFLNEELFRGAITETLYETNSKREAD